MSENMKENFVGQCEAGWWVRELGFVWCQQTILEQLSRLEIKNIYNHFFQDFGSHSSEQILRISGKGRGHTLEHVRRWPFSFRNLWIQKQACFDLGRNSSLKIFCMVSITLSHWLPQKSSSERVLELSVLDHLFFPLLHCSTAQRLCKIYFQSKICCVWIHPLTKFRYHRSWCNWAD